MIEHETHELTWLNWCCKCSGKMVPIFRQIDVRIGTVHMDEAKQMLGLKDVLGGSLQLMEAMGPHNPVKVAKEKETFLFCNNCWLEMVDGFESLEEFHERMGES